MNRFLIEYSNMISFRLADELLEKLESDAKYLNMTKSELLRALCSIDILKIVHLL